MPRPKSTVPEESIPGHARIVLQVYEPGRRRYAQPSGFCLSSIDVKTRREFERLWKTLSSTIEGGAWKDAAQQPKA